MAEIAIPEARPRAATLALKEWAAVARALLDGRQTVLLRKGGIHERAFAVADGRFVLFPTVAHSHAERVRAEHQDLLALGEADVDEDKGTFTVRCGVSLVDVVPAERPEGLSDIADLHIWTAHSVQEDRLDFRPKHPLQVLVVRAFELPAPVTLQRAEEHSGCKSWLDLPLSWDGASGRQAVGEERLRADAARVRAAVG
ncbi:MAG TPA: DUF1802 family protein [Egibacteraceae bacterium]|nr:DUF1802 family protein [Egibacteraceae bacterium]